MPHDILPARQASRRIGWYLARAAACVSTTRRPFLARRVAYALFAMVLSCTPPGLTARRAHASSSAIPVTAAGQTTENRPEPTSFPGADLDPLAAEGDLVGGPKPPSFPDDPCLPSLYKNWLELSDEAKAERIGMGFQGIRLVLDRSTFTLSLEAWRPDREPEILYQSPCGLGDVETPTPKGQFVINHLYCYPDVLFFGNSGESIPSLYNGFFAPVLQCDEEGRCERVRDLGIHGFTPAAHPRPTGARLETCGAVSAGCIRVPDPCKFKTELIRAVGIGPMKKNDRGTYHWLDRPVVVIIRGEYPGTEDQVTLGSVLQEGLNKVQEGLRSVLGVFGP